MQDQAAHLQYEIDNLAALLGATPIRVNEQLIDNNLNISVDQDGKYHWSFWERGKPNEQLSIPVDRGVSGDLRFGVLIAV